jgi:cytochrome c oxidase subunit 2
LEVLNDFIRIWLIFILILIITSRFFILRNKLFGVLIAEIEALEIFWTLFPIFILLRIAFPRFFLLNIQDTRVPYSLLKLIRNQWNWQREMFFEELDHLLDYEGVFLHRNIESPIYLFSRKTQIIRTRTDVLHSVGIPNLGVKIDSSPGRLNRLRIELFKPGLCWGSCYELCGRGHRSIPFSLLIF